MRLNKKKGNSRGKDDEYNTNRHVVTESQKNEGFGQASWVKEFLPRAKVTPEI